MCGVCGVFSFGEREQSNTVSQMVRSIAHRGPDSRGFYSNDKISLGAVRLNITDSSEMGLQPFASDDGHLQLVFNGAIYNYREIKERLQSHGHRFKSDTDTEVVLRAYQQWGKSSVTLFNGMWAFALWNNLTKTLFCSRDRLGVKPFYYWASSETFSFASELKAFTVQGFPTPRPNLPLLKAYLEDGRLDHTNETFFSGIYSLPAGHSVVCNSAGFQVERYWTLEPQLSPLGNQDDIVRDLLIDATRIRIPRDLNYGVCLSGGVDSSTLACAARYIQPDARLSTFSAFFDDVGMEERPYAQSVVEQTGAHPNWITFSAGELVDRLPEVIYAQDEPFSSSSIVAEWFVMKAAKESGIRVMLDGQGADEIFAGYPPFFGYRFADLLGSFQLRKLVSEIGAYRRQTGSSLASTAAWMVRPYLSDGYERGVRSRFTRSRSIVHSDFDEVVAPSSNHVSSFNDRLRTRLERDVISRGLPMNLHSLDRNSMAHGVEARLPYLDYRLVELAFSLDGDQLISGGKTKAVLRRLFPGVMPNLVLDRKSKLGFPTPEARFFREELGVLAMDVFRSRRFRERGWFNVEAICDRLQKHRHGKINAGFELWRALNLELWARAFIDGDRQGLDFPK